MPITSFDTPKRRHSFGSSLKNVKDTNIPLNDDASEIRSRRKSAANSMRSPTNFLGSNVSPVRAFERNAPRPLEVVAPMPIIPTEQMYINFEEWMKLATDNKINASNSWKLALIDYFHEMSLLKEGDSINFQKASCTLDGCVKIYTLRVDSVATETGKLLSGLASNSRDNNEDDDRDSEDADPERHTRKRNTRSETTLVKDYNSLTIKKFDLEFSIDPLFKKTSADFDEGGAQGLLLNHLSVDTDGKIIFDSSDAIPDEDNDNRIDTEDNEPKIEIFKLRCDNLDTNNDVSEVFDEENINPNVRLTEKDYVMAMISNENELFSYFDSAFLRNWAGPEHWKLKKVNKRPTEMEGGTREKKKKEPVSINFIDSEDLDERIIFSSGGSIINAPKLAERVSHSHLLPEDMHFSSKNLLNLFLKPQFMLNSKRRYEAQLDDRNFWADKTNYSNDPVETSFPDFTNYMGGDTFYNDEYDDQLEEGEFGDNLVAQTKRNKPEFIKYAKTAKRIDPQENEMRLSKRLSIENKSKELKFTRVINNLKKIYPQKKMKDISVSFCFICLLHLANEKGLNITSNDQLSELCIDLIISLHLISNAMGILSGSRKLEELFTNTDALPTESSKAQTDTEVSVYELFKDARDKKLINTIKLNRGSHIKYVKDGLKGLPSYLVALDASKPWLCFWMLYSLDILGDELSQDLVKKGISTITKLQNPTGGFGGGPGQISHAAATYAAVNALATIGTKEAYDLIDRETLYNWFLKLKREDGSFVMHEGGEVDVRGAYCVLSAATLTNLVTPELTAGTAEWIKRCQNYDGGIGGEPGIEGHGGYTFCGLAAMEIMGKTDLLDIPLLLRWATSLQMQLEGGFQGRPNKLVDGCYSFWVGGLFPLLEAIMTRNLPEKDVEQSNSEVSKYIAQSLFDREALQEYILIACQSPKGGLIDKPKRGADHYHTCYCLSGLSTAQHHVIYDFERAKGKDLDSGARSLLWKDDVTNRIVLGDPNNLINSTHPIHNVALPNVRKMIEHFYGERNF
ncbi:12144_t:CDS:10 [Rhizophagus irregularis]|nr:12144_t:CDS:10 [Rhizophagus irregularis]